MSAVGAPFGKYYLTEKIATGGMAEIYLAKLIGPGGFEKPLIIKQIHPELSGDQQFVSMFVTEAKTLVSLSHGNIVPIYELGVIDATYFIAMEFIDGPTLERLSRALDQRDRRLEPTEAAYVAAEILKGLDYAHRKGEGVVHRDLSPRNVMVSRDGAVKLVDFGIAVPLDGDREKRRTTGLPVGSFPYMSPEQVEGSALDGRSDLFSTGVLLWELLVGQSLFTREDETTTLEAVTTAPVPTPSSMREGIDPELDRICLRALERDREARYATAADFLRDLSRFIYSQSSIASAESLSRVVAINCPPETASLPSSESDGALDATQAGDYTRPMPGRGRAQTEQSFATHAALEDALSRATPLLGQRALDDDPPVPGEKARDVATARAGSDAKSVPAAVAPTRSGRGGWIALALAVAAVAAGIAWIRYRADGDARVGQADAETPAVPIADAAPPDATSTIYDATVDAAVAERPDARARRPVVPTGTGTVQVGANPWGDVYLGKKHLGRAPGRFSVPAGRHTIEVRFRDQKRVFDVQIKAGASEDLGLADFTSDR